MLATTPQPRAAIAATRRRHCRCCADCGEPSEFLMTTYAKSPVVSILTPAYNSAAYIGETIDSIRAQTFPDFEAIVADDGSTDDTVEVVRRIAEHDPRVIVISSP